MCIRETKQHLSRCMAVHSWANSSGQDPAVYLHLKEKEQSFEDNNAHILDRENRQFGRGVREEFLCEGEKTKTQEVAIYLLHWGRLELELGEGEPHHL